MAPEAAAWQPDEQQSLPVRQVAPAAPQFVLPPPPPLPVPDAQMRPPWYGTQNPEQQSVLSSHALPSFTHVPWLPVCGAGWQLPPP